MNDKLVEVCARCDGRGEFDVLTGHGDGELDRAYCGHCGKGRLGPGVAVAEGVDEAALLRHLEQFDKYSGSAHVHPAMLKQLQEFHASFHSRREQLVEKLCAAVSMWLQEEANSMFRPEDRYDASALRYAAEKAEEPTGRGEHLAVLLDHALGEEKK